MRLAHHHLDLVLWHQQEHLGPRHPRALVTQRECITTSLVRGVWYGKPASRWAKRDLLDVESQARRVHSLLEQALGPLHRETMATLALVLSVRVSLVRQAAIPWEAMELVLDELRARRGEPAARAPGRLLGTLRVGYKAGASVARVWRYRGEAMLEELLEETDGLILAGREDVKGLMRFRREVREKVEELRKQRRKEEEKGGYKVS